MFLNCADCGKFKNCTKDNCVAKCDFGWSNLMTFPLDFVLRISQKVIKTRRDLPRNENLNQTLDCNTEHSIKINSSQDQ